MSGRPTMLRRDFMPATVRGPRPITTTWTGRRWLCRSGPASPTTILIRWSGEPWRKPPHLFLGRHDFLAFAASSSEVKTTDRECTASHLYERGHELVYEVKAEGFLHHMVRNIVGTLLENRPRKDASRDR